MYIVEVLAVMNERDDPLIQYLDNFSNFLSQTPEQCRWLQRDLNPGPLLYRAVSFTGTHVWLAVCCKIQQCIFICNNLC